MVDCLFVRRVCAVHLVDESATVFMPPYDWANSGSADVFIGMVSIVLVLWELALFYRMGAELKGEIFSNYSRRVEWQQGITEGIGVYVYVFVCVYVFS